MVLPAPANEASVAVPAKLSALASVRFALLTAPSVTLPLKEAFDELSRVRAAEPAASVAVRLVPVRLREPPLRCVTVPVAPARVTEPVVRVVIVATPPIEVAPPLIVVIVASEPKVVLPAPANEASVAVPAKLSALASVLFALLTAPRDTLPLKEAFAEPLSVSVAPELTSAAVNVAALTAIEVVPANEPAEAFSVPPLTVVVPV